MTLTTENLNSALINKMAEMMYNRRMKMQDAVESGVVVDFAAQPEHVMLLFKAECVAFLTAALEEMREEASLENVTFVEGFAKDHGITL